MSTDPVHPSAVGTNTIPMPHSVARASDDPTLSPQRHVGAVGLGPNYPLGPSLGDKLEGMAEELKGKVLGKPELVEQGHERRTGELMRKERERDDAANLFEAAQEEKR